MYYSWCLLLVFAFAVRMRPSMASDSESDSSEIENVCLKECNLKEQQFSKFLMKSDNITPKAYWCYQRCNFVQAGYLDEDGTVRVDNIMKDVSKIDVPKEAKAEAQECLDDFPKVVTLEDMRDLMKCFSVFIEE